MNSKGTLAEKEGLVQLTSSIRKLVYLKVDNVFHNFISTWRSTVFSLPIK
jgi:hypothetical protein